MEIRAEKANLLKKSNLASSPYKISKTSKKRTQDQLPNIKYEVIASNLSNPVKSNDNQLRNAFS